MRRRSSRRGAARAASALTPDNRLVGQILEASGLRSQFVEFINRIGRGQSKHPHPSALPSGSLPQNLPRPGILPRHCPRSIRSPQ